MSYGSPSGASVGSEPTAPSLTLTNGQTYTANLRISFVDNTTLAITNSIYAGAGVSGTPLSQFGGLTTSTTWVTGGFDALAIGWYQKAGSIITTIDISSIVISGHATAVTGPPDIVTQPSPVSVPAGAAGDFAVVANGYSMTYQWHRYNTNLVDGGNIAGATSATLVISPASATDVASGANGYWVTVHGAGGFSTNSTTNSLSLRTAADLVWSGSGTDWDLNTSANWLKGSTPAVFNFGDNVTFNDTGIGNLAVNLAGSFLSAASVTVNSASDYVFSGTGNFAGPGHLLYIGGGHLTMSSANSYSGGTLISNATAFLVLNNYGALGTGPVTLAQAGGQMELSYVANGSHGYGINGDITVQDDFTITCDGASAYSAIFAGNLAGTAGKTLTINLNNSDGTTARLRVFGTNTVYDGNLNLTDSRLIWASYQDSGSQSYNGVISGSGAFMQKGTTTYLNGTNTYSGGTMPATGFIGLGTNTTESGGTILYGPIGTGPLSLFPDSTTGTTGSGGVLASGGARTVANPIQYQSGTNNFTLIIGGTNALTLSGAITLNGNDGLTTNTYTNRIFQVTNTALTTFSGVISDNSGFGYGLIKTGSGVLALGNIETYTGPTTISNGTLQVNGQLAAASAVTVCTNAILGGTGTVGGSVAVNAGGALAPGNSIGTLKISGNLSLAGNLKIEVNKSLSPTSDKVEVTGTRANTGTGTITVTNQGPALVVNDKFYLFNNGVTGGGALTVIGGGVAWNNNLASDGSISVASVIQPIITSAVLSGTNLVFSGSNGAVGVTYYVLSSTNVAAPLSSWVPTSTNTFITGGAFSVTNPIVPGVPVRFYRLKVP